MLKKTVTYTDYNGLERTEDFYFNLTEAEVAEKELSTEGGYVEMLNSVVKAKKAPELVKIFKDLVLESYGEKSADGRKFIKSDELKLSFSHTVAYSKIFMEMATNAEAAAEFVNGIMPKPAAKPSV